MITKRYYKLNRSLDSFADYSIFRRAGLEPKNKIEKLRSKIIHYKKKIQQASEKHISDLQDLFLEEDQESYTHKIVLPNGDYYNLTWNIAKAKKLITENNITPQIFNVKMLSDCIAPGAVDQHNLNLNRKIDSPLIVVELQKNMLNAVNPYIIIDGNHRLTVNLLNNEKHIKAFLLSPKIHLQALSSELDCLLYKIHHNKHIMVDYLFGTISKSTMEDMLFEI